MCAALRRIGERTLDERIGVPCPSAARRRSTYGQVRSVGFSLSGRTHSSGIAPLRERPSVSDEGTINWRQYSVPLWLTGHGLEHVGA